MSGAIKGVQSQLKSIQTLAVYCALRRTPPEPGADEGQQHSGDLEPARDNPERLQLLQQVVRSSRCPGTLRSQ